MARTLSPNRVVNNKYLSDIFDKIEVQKAIYLENHTLKCGEQNVNFKATFIEALLGLTEIMAPEHMSTVVSSIIDTHLKKPHFFHDGACQISWEAES